MKAEQQSKYFPTLSKGPSFLRPREVTASNGHEAETTLSTEKTIVPVVEGNGETTIFQARLNPNNAGHVTTEGSLSIHPIPQH